MIFDAEIQTVSAGKDAGAELPGELLFTEHLLREFRAYLSANSLCDYSIFYCIDMEIDDIDRHMQALGEPHACWEPLAPDPSSNKSLTKLRHDEKETRISSTGCLHLRRRQVVLARWHWVNPDDTTLQELWLCAAPSAEHYDRLRKRLRKIRRETAASVWQVVNGPAWRDGPRMPRERVGKDDLVITPAVRQRIDAEVVGFFSESVQAMYRQMNVPYRRGVLMHGPPGNGKTSLIRLIGGALPHVPGMILRPVGEFGNENLQQVFRRWSRQGPAMLVIEDLNWMLKSIDLSLFLNLLDGLDSRTDSTGLMLIATTNHPDMLDPAINNRPGRFDVVIEIPSPDELLRGKFLRLRLPEISEKLLDHLVSISDGWSFAHLQELLRLSGLQAIHDGRSQRNEIDLRSAAQSVRDGIDNAVRGFPRKTEIPFGLGYLRTVRANQEK